MKEISLALAFLLLLLKAEAQQKVLVFSKTASYVHESIPAGIQAITTLGKRNGFSVDETKDPKIFTDANLKKYAAIIFLSPTGNFLDTLEKVAIQRFIQAGGGF